MIPRQDMKTGGNEQDIIYGYFHAVEFTQSNTNHIYKKTISFFYLQPRYDSVFNYRSLTADGPIWFQPI